MTCRWIVALALLLLSVSVTQADVPAAEHVTVYGTASLQVAPDQMRWRLNVRNVHPQSAGAAEEHGSLVASVLAFLEQSHIAEETMQTSGLQLGENWSVTHGSQVRDGYFASTDLSFTLTEFANYASIWIGLSRQPGVTVRGVAMDHTDRIRFQNEARAKAVLAARDKAQGIAETLGVRLGGPLIVEEDLSVNEDGRARFSTMTNVADPVGEPADVAEYLAPGSIPIRARVKAVFRLLPKP